ncbi:MBL fold metallo-hydrolase [Neobacillus massiliamazoniensis]|uniref:Zn-dependent hydrolase n=1 Tax=Neobacillus massiliamazoniensis TaxID=1499688 RepID=A0A0U1NXM6_9BACI|nr:MBL fold metallo-hydrolase [Neobacillus massiliamazoniensis]CRK82780.1 Zn-dependent hydrolase [Neobacillus massiliamazoniensis]
MNIVETKYFNLQRLSDGVYAAIANPGEGAWSNAGFVDLGNELLVFDSFSTPIAAKELLKQAEEITGKKVKYLINSHYHGDHVFGNQVFIDSTIISTSLTRKLFEEKNVIDNVEKEQEEMGQYLKSLEKQIESTTDTILKHSLLNQFKEMSKVLEAVPYLKMVLPNLIFEKNLVIHGSKRNVELHCYGGGHTPSDCFLYLPEEKIAFMGDIVTVETHVPIYNPEEFVAILNKVKQIDIETIVPGHGCVGNLKLCDILIDYLSILIQKAKEAQRYNLSQENFMSGFSTPAEYNNWKSPNGIKRNLSTVYNFYKKPE